jgi:Raf kinase inhibitor-like YbhB/YbcL family protein
MDQDTGDEGLLLTSPAFKESEEIPKQYTCKGDNVSPPLNITGVPSGTKSLALIMHDPDAIGSDFTHWLMWDIPTNTKAIAANSVPVGALQGSNGYDNTSYAGPCPPAGSGTHRYIFELYALGNTLNLTSAASRGDLQEAMKDHVLAQSTLTGLVAA